MRCAQWSGLDLDPERIASLETFRRWLITEADKAGGIGPREADRVDDRHIGDSLLMAKQLLAVGEVWDLGSGAGLPGVPLAISQPQRNFVLVDRSGRRIHLLRRISRILDLQNVDVRHDEIERLEGPITNIVSRATLPAEKARTEFSRLLSPGGVAVLGGSWARRPSSEGWETTPIPRRVLDRDVWLLIMRQP